MTAALVCAVIAQPAQAGHGLEAAMHGLDHPVPPFVLPQPPSLAFNAGGEGAEWEVVDTIATGNPHTDIDFFTSGGETYVAAGTLGIGPNAGGQTIVRLTDDGEVAPELVSAQPSASCLSDPSAALGLQHDVEATPKGGAPLNTRNPFADGSDAQLLIDATDNSGRCHDQGNAGIVGAPQGGLEIIDVTNPESPVEIGLTSHIGEAHTVNVDPKRPHIAYAVTADSVGLNAEGVRANEVDGSLALDGFEMVDLRSCMNFRPGASLERKRNRCRPKVYRYRYPNATMGLGHTVTTGGSAIYGCHELEIYPSDLLTCASGNALIGLDMSRAFNDRGTPNDYSDDRPRGTPLSCRRRASTSLAPLQTGAIVTDCVDGRGEGTTDLAMGEWLAAGAPSLRGVRWLGSIYHQGGGPPAARHAVPVRRGHRVQPRGRAFALGPVPVRDRRARRGHPAARGGVRAGRRHSGWQRRRPRVPSRAAEPAPPGYARRGAARVRPHTER